MVFSLVTNDEEKWEQIKRNSKRKKKLTELKRNYGKKNVKKWHVKRENTIEFKTKCENMCKIKATNKTQESILKPIFKQQRWQQYTIERRKRRIGRKREKTPIDLH